MSSWKRELRDWTLIVLAPVAAAGAVAVILLWVFLADIFGEGDGD